MFKKTPSGLHPNCQGLPSGQRRARVGAADDGAVGCLAILHQGLPGDEGGVNWKPGSDNLLNELEELGKTHSHVELCPSLPAAGGPIRQKWSFKCWKHRNGLDWIQLDSTACLFEVVEVVLLFCCHLEME